MSILSEERFSDSPYIEKIMHGWTISKGSAIRPAENHWHLVFVKVNDRALPLVVGALTTSGVASWGEGAEILWIQFKLGTFMPHLPTKTLVDKETLLPDAASTSFWLKGSAWEIPNYENVDTFVNRLVRDDVLVRDPIVDAALQDRLPEMSARTVRHHFLRAIGLTQKHIRQMERAQQAAALLEQGVSILDTVDAAGYFDQAHLTRSLKRFIGFAPTRIIDKGVPK